MDNLALDLYGNLLITFLGIFTPLISILMNISRDGIDNLIVMNKKAVKVFQEEISSCAAQQVNSSDNSNPDIKKIKESVNSMEKEVKDHKKDLRLLRPRRQFVRTFGTLSVSFILLIAYLVAEMMVFDIDIPFVTKSWYLILSILAFLYALYIIWQIITILIKVREIEQDLKFNEHISQDPKPVNNG